MNNETCADTNDLIVLRGILRIFPQLPPLILPSDCATLTIFFVYFMLRVLLCSASSWLGHEIK